MKSRVTTAKRMSRSDVMLVALAIGSGIGGAWLAGRYLDARAEAAESALAGRYAQRAVVVASRDVAAGQILQTANLAARHMPQDFLPPDAVPVERAGELLGGRLAIDIRRGTPIVPAALSATASAPRLSGLLAPGERALTVPVDEIDSHAGAVGVGDRIDVYYRPGAGDETLLMPLLQQVEVLATGASFLPDADAGEDERGVRNYGTVTLRLGEEDAARLLLAQAAGDLALVLRAPGDAQRLAVAVRSSRELLRPVGNPASRRRIAGTELLTGGSGGVTPSRTWLPAGTAEAVRQGDAS